MSTKFYQGQKDYIEKLNEMDDDVAAVPSTEDVQGMIDATVGALNTDDIPELTGAVNNYHTAGRVRNTPLSGLSVESQADVVASDSVIEAMGKFQAKWDALPTSVRQTRLQGLVTTDSSELTVNDVIIEALGKLQAQITSLSSGLPEDVLTTPLTGVDIELPGLVTDTDTLLEGIGKLQAQCTSLGADKQDNPLAFSTLGSTTLSSLNDGGRYNPSATGDTYTIPLDLHGADGTNNFGCMFSNPGTVIISPDSGVTINGLTTNITCTQTNSKRMVGIIQTAANTFTVLGA